MTKQGNYRIIIEPLDPWGKPTETAWRSNCNQLIADIQRHVDGFAHIFWESDTLCEFCDSPWEVQPVDTDDTPKGLPLCCDEAAQEWFLQQKKSDEKLNVGD